MSKRDELIVKYAADLKDKCGVTADMDLLTKVVIGCGPSIYNADAATVSGSDEKVVVMVSEFTQFVSVLVTITENVPPVVIVYKCELPFGFAGVHW